jgi:iron transport multicopper oxidase
MTAAQRFSVLVNTKNSTQFNYLMHADMDTVMFDTLPDALNPSKFIFNCYFFFFF